MNIRKMNIENLETKPASGVRIKKPKKNEALKIESNPVNETGGPKGPEPTRYGDWEQKGRCTDF